MTDARRAAAPIEKGGLMKNLDFVYAHLTPQRVSDFLDALKAVDARALRLARRALPERQAEVLGLAQDLRTHPTQAQIGNALGVAALTVHRNLWLAMLAVAEDFSRRTGVKVSVRRPWTGLA